MDIKPTSNNSSPTQKMKILDAGHHPLSNADVLEWAKLKRAQHEREDADDKQRGLAPAKRPPNFMRILQRTERELSAARHPFAANPSAYAGDARGESFRKFAVQVEDAVLDHADAEWRVQGDGQQPQQQSAAEREKAYAALQEKKCLSRTELLVIFNHAPTCVEMLQPMIEQVDDRFTPEEQQLIIDVCVKMLRPDQEQYQGEET